MILKKISIMETNINLKVDNEKYVNLCEKTILKQRGIIKNYILNNPEFLSSYEPIPVPYDSPEIIKTMAKAGYVANVGPMASVAGTISEFVVKKCVEYGCNNIICENGGDIALKSEKDVVVGLYAGKSSLSGNIGFKINSDKCNNLYGVCTSSGTVGHSVSFGSADAVVVFSKYPSIADAAATSICNYSIGTPEEAINKCLEVGESIEHIEGIFVVIGEYAGKTGKVPKLVKTDDKLVKSTIGEYFDIL